MSHLDVRLPVRVGQDAARPVQASVAGQSAASTSGNALDVSREKPPPVAVVVEGCPSIDQSDCKPRPSRPRLVDLVPRTATARGSESVGVDLRRCRSLDNVHAFAGAADNRRSFALLMIAN